MVKEGNVLRHKFSRDGIEVDQAKIQLIKKLPPLISVKGVRRFLGQVIFYRRFIKDFSKIVISLCKLLGKESTFFLNCLYGTFQNTQGGTYRYSYNHCTQLESPF